MTKGDSGRSVLWWEVAAFGLLIALTWADELLGIPALCSAARIIPTSSGEALSRDRRHPVGRDSRRDSDQASRGAPLPSGRIPRVCAWCQKVEEGGNWFRSPSFAERFDARTDSHGIRIISGTNSTSGKLLICQLLVRGRSGMNDEALAIADIGEMREKLHVLNELFASLAPRP